MRMGFILVLLPALVFGVGPVLAQDISKQHGRDLGDTLFDTQTTPPPAPTGSSSAETDKKAKSVRVFLGYSSYLMSDFNDKLASEGNEEINAGFNAGIEFLADIPIPKVPGLSLPAIGIEYLEASSATTHAGTDVDWELPVLGLFIAPEFNLKNHRWYFRPVGLGYYTIGEIVEAKLSISDRPGHLELSGSAIGAFSRVGFRIAGKDTQLALELGLRYLKFTNLTRTPKSGFTAVPGGPLVQPSSLPETLDYSGLSLSVSLSLDVGGKG